MKRSRWSKNEDLLLKNLIDEAKKATNWNFIAKQMGEHGHKRSPKQIRSRWYNSVMPNLNKDKWELIDVEKLFDMYSIKGNKWKRISREFDGRSDNNVKNQFFSVVRRSLRTMIRIIHMETLAPTTNTINQIKPKNLIDFLAKKIVLQDDHIAASPNTFNVLDLIKELYFNRYQILKDISLCKRKIIFEYLFKSIIKNNFEESSNEEKNQMTTNVEVEQFIINITDVREKEEQSTMFFRQSDATLPGQEKIDSIEFPTDGRSEVNVEYWLNYVKQMMLTYKTALDKNPNDIENYTNMINLLSAFKDISQLIQGRLQTNSFNTRTFTYINNFFNSVHFKDNSQLSQFSRFEIPNSCSISEVNDPCNLELNIFNNFNSMRNNLQKDKKHSLRDVFNFSMNDSRDMSDHANVDVSKIVKQDLSPIECPKPIFIDCGNIGEKINKEKLPRQEELKIQTTFSLSCRKIW